MLEETIITALIGLVVGVFYLAIKIDLLIMRLKHVETCLAYLEQCIDVLFDDDDPDDPDENEEPKSNVVNLINKRKAA